MLNRDEVIKKMSERDFIVYAGIGDTKIMFISKCMFEMEDMMNILKEEKEPIINVIVDLEKDEFSFIYYIDKSINSLNSPKFCSVMIDENFNKILSKFLFQASWLEKMPSIK